MTYCCLLACILKQVYEREGGGRERGGGAESDRERQSDREHERWGRAAGRF